MVNWKDKTARDLSMNKRLLVISVGIITGIFLAGVLRAEEPPAKIAEMGESRYSMNVEKAPVRPMPAK